jgi:transcriptional regulatory protein RtcR
LRTFTLPGLREWQVDIEPNLQFELDQYAENTGTRVTFNREARNRFLDFALSPSAMWKDNFRDLNAAVARMSTLCSGGRISVEIVEEEIVRLNSWWRTERRSGAFQALARLLSKEQNAELDLFDRLQLEQVVAICQRSRTISEAGRQLFDHSRTQKATPKDADRLRKYLARFGLDWAVVSAKH